MRLPSSSSSSKPTSQCCPANGLACLLLAGSLTCLFHEKKCVCPWPRWYHTQSISSTALLCSNQSIHPSINLTRLDTIQILPRGTFTVRPNLSKATMIPTTTNNNKNLQHAIVRRATLITVHSQYASRKAPFLLRNHRMIA